MIPPRPVDRNRNRRRGRAIRRRRGPHIWESALDVGIHGTAPRAPEAICSDPGASSRRNTPRTRFEGSRAELADENLPTIELVARDDGRLLVHEPEPGRHDADDFSGCDIS